MTAQNPDQAIDQELGEDLDVEYEIHMADVIRTTGPGMAREHQPWRISGIETADWALRRIRRLDERIAEIEELYRREVFAIDRWRAEALGTLERDRRYFEGRLADYHAAILEIEPKRLTIKLPAGTLSSTAGSVTVEVTDEAALASWLVDNAPEDTVEQYLEYVPKVRKDAIREAYGAKLGAEAGTYPAVTEDGEIVPGVELVRRPRSFKPKPAPTEP